MSTNPYGVTIANPSSTLPTQRITDMLGMGIGWMRYQVNWSNVETGQSPPTYNWAKLDDAISKCNAAGIKFVLPIQNGPTWGVTAWDRTSIAGTLSAVGQSVFCYLNAGGGIYQLGLTGTFSAGTTLIVDSSADGISWTGIQTVGGPGPLTIFGDCQALVFLRVRCSALHGGDSVAVQWTVTEITASNSATINASTSIAFAHLGNNTIAYEFAWSGTFSSGTHLVIEQSTDNSTWSFVQDVFGPNPPAVFGLNSISPCYMRARRIALTTGDSIAVAISGSGPSAANKNYLTPSNVVAFAQAVAHRYTVGDPQNAGGMHIEAIEIGNEGADDNNDALLKTPYWLVQALIPAYSAIKAINPNMLVGPACHLQLTNAHIRSWQQAFYLYGGGPYADYSNLHYYPGQYDPTTIVAGQSTDVTFAQYWAAVHAIDVANGYGAKKIRVTEFGWPRGIEDSFTTNDSSLYTSDALSGGAPGAWTFDTANGRLIGTGGNHAAYYQTSNAAKFQVGYDEVTLDWAEQAGIGLRWVDSNNSYLCEINDASAALHPNTLRVIVRLAGVNTVIASASISFQRGTRHTIHFEAVGHFPVDAQTTILVQFDGTQVISVGDTTMQTGGYAFLYQNGKIQAQHFTMVQSGNVTYQQQSAYIQDVLDSARTSGVVEAVFPFTLDNTNGYSPVSVKSGVETQYPAYAMFAGYARVFPYWVNNPVFALFPATSRRAGTFPGATRRTGLLPGIARRRGMLPSAARRHNPVLPAPSRRQS